MYFIAHFLTYWLSCLYYLYHDSKLWDKPDEWNKVKIQKWKPNIKELWKSNSLASLRNNVLTYFVIYLFVTQAAINGEQSPECHPILTI